MDRLAQIAKFAQAGEMERALRELDKLPQDSREVVLLRARVLTRMKRLEEAAGTFSTLVEHFPDFEEGLLDAAILAENTWSWPLAKQRYEAVRDLNADSLEAHFGLLRADVHLGDFFSAVEGLAEAAADCRNSDISLRNLIAAQHYAKLAGNLELALSIVAVQARLFPDFVAGRINEMVLSLYDDSVSDEHVQVLHRSRMEILEGLIRPYTSYTNNRNPDRVLRVGFLSADFRQHSVAFFSWHLLENRFPEDVQVTAYSLESDDRTDQILALADRSRRMDSSSATEIAEKIRSDKIDILIDLTGPLDLRVAEVMLLQPAPVQLMMVGYPHSYGSDRIPHRIADGITDPSAGHTVEAMRAHPIDPCFLCYKPFESPLACDRSEPGLVFGSLNKALKLSETTVALWSRLLQETPGSVLVLKASNVPVKAYNDASEKQLVSRFVKHGVRPDRIRVTPFAEDRATPGQEYGGIDVALDPYPYNGTTTTVEALAHGVPVVSLYGASHRTRVSLSLLSAVGYPEWATDDPEEFLTIAKSLIHDPAQLRHLRYEIPIRLKSSVLTDTEDYQRRLVEVLRQLWVQYCEES